jgi:two-component system response regulator HydG
MESGEVNRVGSLESRTVDVAVIAATNRDLRAEVAAGRFRTDLYYRLNVVELRLPPLREHREDIPYLTASFVRATSESLGKNIAGITPGAERMLVGARWDGNVREVRNVIERACILTDTEFVTEKEISLAIPAESRTGAPQPAGQSTGQAEPVPTANQLERLAELEREHIQRALERTGGNKKAAAQMLGLSRRALYRRLERLELSDTIARRRAPESVFY